MIDPTLHPMEPSCLELEHAVEPSERVPSSQTLLNKALLSAITIRPVPLQKREMSARARPT
jgi:hypothetical protein